MSHLSGSRSRMTYSKLEEYEYGHYRDLKYERIKVRASGAYRCPYCFKRTKREYSCKELIRHATRIAEDSDSQDVKEKAKHSALLDYLKKYHDNSRSQNRNHSNRGRAQSTSDLYEDSSKRGRTDFASRVAHHYGLDGQMRSGLKAASSDDCKSTPSGITKPAYNVDVRNQEEASSHAMHNGTNNDDDDDQNFVWPCMGVVANIKTELKDGRPVAESCSKLKQDLTSKGFNPSRVHPLWNKNGHSGYAIVEFDKDWTGLSDAINFERYFLANRRGKNDYFASKQSGDQLFGWVARDDDYNSKSIVGRYLRKKGDLMTVARKQAEEKTNDRKLMSTLRNTLEEKNKLKAEMECKLSITMKALNKLEKEKDEMLKQHNEEIIRLQQNEHDRYQKICQEHENITLQLESKRKELEEREEQLKRWLVNNESECRKINEEIKMHEKASVEQKKAEENLLRLAEEQKKEKENLHMRIIELEKKLDAEQQLKLEIQRMRGALQVMKHIEDEDVETKKKMEKLCEELKEKEEEMEGLEELNQTLIVKERKTNDELQEARKECINAMEQLTKRAYIGVKRMGDLDVKPFVEACKRMNLDKEKALELCSTWEEYIRDPSWLPFKTATVDGKVEEIIDEEDEKLKNLKEEYGDQVFGAVSTALMEMNAYNPSGRYIIPELWHLREKRKASLGDVAEFLLTLWKRLKPKRRRT